MAIDRRGGTRRTFTAPRRSPADVAADERIKATLRQLPASVTRGLDWHLWDGVDGERAMREALAEAGIGAVA